MTGTYWSAIDSVLIGIEQLITSRVLIEIRIGFNEAHDVTTDWILGVGYV